MQITPIRLLIFGLLPVLTLYSFLSSCGEPSRASSQRTPVPDSALAIKVDPRELAANPRDWRGRNVTLTGSTGNVSQHKDYTWVSFHAQVPGRSFSQNLVVELSRRDSSVVKDECYQVWGVVGEPQSVRVVLTGAQDTRPLIRAYNWMSLPTTRYGGCEESTP